MAEATLQTWTFVWLVTAAIVLIRHWRPGAGVGLVFTYVLSFGVMHWLAATIYLLPWYGGPRLDFTASGLREAAIAMIAFAVGSEITLAILRRRHIESAGDTEEQPVAGRLVTLYLVAGAVLYGVILPLASRLPSVTAFASAGSTLMVVGVSLKCWNSWVRGAGPRLWMWLAATSVFPLMTLITQGFLGYGFAAMLTIFAFVASIFRPRWRVVVVGVVLAYVGLSVYVTYMRDRSDIRAVVWAGGAVDERVTQVTDTFGNVEWFDLSNEDHLQRIDGRLNQNFLIGAAVAYIGDGSASFAKGGTFGQAIVALVPRALWPNKPVVAGSGNLVADYTGFRFAEGTSVGIGQVMESYVNFGTTGVVIGFLLIGAALALTDRMSYLRLSQGGAYGFLLWYLPGLALLQVGGSFMEVTSTAGAALGVAVALNYLAPYLAPDRSRLLQVEDEPETAPDTPRGEPVTPMLAAITLHPRGGGVATVSRLLKDVLEETWRHDLRVVTLLGDDAPPAGRVPLASRLSFGGRVAAGAASRDCPWILFAHPSLARVQSFIPSPWRKPYAVFLHGVEAWNPLAPAQRRVLERASLLLANSRFTAERVAAAHPTLPPIAACPLALPRDTRAAAPAATFAVPPRTVLVVARMSAAERYKGHDQLIEAWPAVRSRVPDASLVLVGDGDDVPRLTAKAASLAPGAVTFTGFVSDANLARWYQGASVLAMPSRGEGFGLAYLEAMRHGVPCLGSPDDAAREVIEDGVSGFLVDQSRTDQIADRLTTLLIDEPLRRAMGEAGRRRAAQEFSRDRFASRLQSLLAGAFGADEAAGLDRVPGPAR